ncbi:MAG: WS/DGAT domain-containing protein [Actinomycetia bacterium]|nr:WS/DGAT domain-containing protein [Actinomycetes bacterium]
MGQVDEAIRNVNDLRGVGRQMSGFDAGAWRGGLKDRTLRSAIVGILLLDQAPDWDRFLARYDRLTRKVPVLRQRPIFGAADLLMPRLALDPDFDLSLHLRRTRLPDGADWNDVLAEARRMSLMDFDHDRPLWETAVLEGLPGGFAAIIFKMHHAIGDGKATVEMGTNLLEFTREGNPDEPAAPPAPEAENASVTAITTANLTDTAERLVGVATGGLRIVGELAVGTLRSPMETWSEAFNTLRSIRRATEMPDGEMSPVMSKRSATYTFRTFDVPFQQMRGAAKKHDFTVNDVFLASCSTGLAKYHARFGESAPELRFIIPVSLRDTSKDGSTANEVALARFPLPVTGVSVAERLQAAHDEVRRWRDEPALALTNPIMDASWLVPVPVLARSARGTDVTTSNVPGPPIPCYISGAQIVGTWPLVATGGGAANITMVTYDGTAFVGVSSDDKAIADPDAFLADLRDGFAEVIAAPVGPGSPIEEAEHRQASHAQRTVGEQAAANPSAKAKSPRKRTAAKKATAKKAATKKASPSKRASATAAAKKAATKSAKSQGTTAAKTAPKKPPTAKKTATKPAADKEN